MVRPRPTVTRGVSRMGVTSPSAPPEGAGGDRRGRSLGAVVRAVFAAATISVTVSSGAPAAASPEPRREIALPGDALHPESITATADGTLYVSGFGSGGVVRVRPGETAGETWIAPGAFGTRSTFGVLADEATNTLWVCSNDLSAIGVPGPGGEKGAALKGFNLKTGAGKLSAPFPVSPAICNDIALGPDGAAYVTNTLGPHILRLKPGAQALEIWKTDPLFETGPGEPGLDGIAFGADGNLYLDTFGASKLFLVAVNDGVAGTVTALKASRPLTHADALRPLGDGSFLLAEGGGRLDRLTITGDVATIEVLRDGIAGGATGVATVGDTAFVTVGQLAVLTDPAKRGARPDLPFRILAIPLKQP